MDEKFTWTRALEAQLIENIQKEPAIWDPAARTYKNRYAKASAFERVQKRMGSAVQKLPTSQISKKWTNMRAYFQTLLNKSRGRSGAGAEDVVVSWEHFHEMQFLKPSLTTTPIVGDITRPPPSSTREPVAGPSNWDVNEIEEQAAFGASNDVVASLQVQEDSPTEMQEQDDLRDNNIPEEPDEPEDLNFQRGGLQRSPSRPPDEFIPHAQRRPRRVHAAVNANEDLDNAMIEFFRSRSAEASVSNQQTRETLTDNQKRGIVWGTDIDKIKNLKLRYTCIMRVNTLIQETLLEDISIEEYESD